MEDIQYSLEELTKASQNCKGMENNDLAKYVKICSQQSTVVKFYSTGKLDPNNSYYKSCKAIIAENQNRVIQKIGFQNQDFDLSLKNNNNNNNNAEQQNNKTKDQKK